MGVNQHRLAFVIRLMELGWNKQLIGPVPWGLHPFDNSPVPPRKLEKKVRKRSYVLLEEVRDLKHDEVSSSRFTASALHDYSSYARAIGALNFSENWERLALQIDNALTFLYPSESEQNSSVTAVAPRVVNGNKIGPNMDLRGIDLSGANLMNVNLNYTNLTGANLTGANLTGANLVNANLTGVNLTGAEMTNAYLVDAEMTNANMTGANMTGANLAVANLTGANLTGANLARTYSPSTNLTGADLTGADLTGADLTGATMPDGKKHP